MATNTNGQNFVRELMALKDLNDFLVLVCNRIMQVNGAYKNYIDIMEETGVPIQECEAYRNQYFAEDEKHFKELHTQITNADLPQIKKYIEHISIQFQQATGMNYGGLDLKTPDMSVSNTAPKNATTRTGGAQDYEKQADAGCDLMDFLVEQCNEIRTTISDYKKYCQEMLNNGVPQQVYKHYVGNFAVPNIQKIDNIATHIESEDYPYLKGVYVTIVNAISSLGGSYSRTPKTI